MQRIWVQLCGKNRYQGDLLIMHKRKRGKWVFIDMINGGLLALLTIHGVYRTSSPSGVITVSEALLLEQSSTKGGRQHWNRMHKHMIMLSMMWMYYLWHLQFKWSSLHFKCKFKLHMLFKLTKLQIPSFVFHKPCDHVCDILLRYKLLGLHCKGWN